MTQTMLGSELPLDAVLAAMPNGVVMLDSRGLISHANPAAQQLLGQSLEGVLWRDVIQSAFAPRDDDGHEVSLASGKRVRLDISALSPHPGQLIVITDMSETRALQERVSHMQRLSAMGRMVASLAHQIRTPLSAAMLYAQNLCRESLPALQREKFSRKLSDRLLDLEQQVNDMLLFAKSGEQLPVEHLQANDVLQRVAEQMESISERSQVEFSVVPCEQPVGLVGNMSALTSALQNLVVNAFEACQPGQRVVLHAQLEQQRIFLAVSDNGPGIPEADQAQIFTPFFTRKSQGTGLGLAVVNTVAKAHQGEVLLRSEVGRGTTISIVIPVSEERS
ncbi:sensor histidine kinase [Aliidiomarina maris]|uniref:histidine kinase n=2 Tax=Aliidiomarina maris TaxID=531312 RepID=A0A327WUF1_9GAMM|nr:ATP-binding protein [Aliidiomarina maris]MCL5050480.1 ATP-binding protein [Bacillota bacterium]RAJ94621.1 two-component system sensor histidine kinase FlrB [Aliidiomarina maris]